MLVIELPKGVVAGRRENRPIAGFRHPQLEQGGELGLVLDDEDPFSHGRLPATSRERLALDLRHAVGRPGAAA